MTASIIILVLFSFVNLILGSIYTPASNIFAYFTAPASLSSEYFDLIHEFKIPKLLAAIFAGASLSIAGLLMQTIFRNPLAGPYVLGISSGAGLGVALLLIGSSVFVSSAFSFMNSLTVAAAAWIGAASVLLIIFFISLKVKDTITILIVGVLIGSVISAFVSLLQFSSNANDLKAFIIWTLGSLRDVTRENLYVIAPAVGLGILISVLLVRNLDVLLTGEENAKTLGVNISLTRILIFASTSLLAGTVTAFCGPIGFVGIIVPHFARMIFKSAKHSVLIPASAILGALMLVISDIISGLPGGGAVLPVNSVTAILGIPVLIKIIIERKGI